MKILLPKKQLTAGTYATGLEHYLAEGKDAELKNLCTFYKSSWVFWK